MNKEEEIDYFDYFHTKYGSDISDLFLDIKEITEGFCLQIFNDSKTSKQSYIYYSIKIKHTYKIK